MNMMTVTVTVTMSVTRIKDKKASSVILRLHILLLIYRQCFCKEREKI